MLMIDLPYRNDRFGIVLVTTTDRPAAAPEFRAGCSRLWITVAPITPNTCQCSSRITAGITTFKRLPIRW